ncbi:MAG: hypothetical protein JWM91_3720 [Rhodospirillales bacterium]|nr:hypothetical protein [Rhodospirillales bacterium]
MGNKLRLKRGQPFGQDFLLRPGFLRQCRNHFEFFSGDQFHPEQKPLDVVAQLALHAGTYPAQSPSRAVRDARHVIKQSSITQHSSDLLDANRRARIDSAVILGSTPCLHVASESGKTGVPKRVSALSYSDIVPREVPRKTPANLAGSELISRIPVVK